jgi:hypothetical protein
VNANKGELALMGVAPHSLTAGAARKFALLMLRYEKSVSIRAHPWLISPRPYGIQSGHRFGDARPAQDEVQDVVRVRQRVRRAAEHERLSSVPGSAGRPARCQRGGAPLTVLTGLLLHCEIPRFASSTGRTISSGYAEILPDHPGSQAVHADGNVEFSSAQVSRVCITCAHFSASFGEDLCGGTSTTGKDQTY